MPKNISSGFDSLDLAGEADDESLYPLKEEEKRLSPLSFLFLLYNPEMTVERSIYSVQTPHENARGTSRPGTKRGKSYKSRPSRGYTFLSIFFLAHTLAHMYAIYTQKKEKKTAASLFTLAIKNIRKRYYMFFYIFWALFSLPFGKKISFFFCWWP